MLVNLFPISQKKIRFADIQIPLCNKSWHLERDIKQCFVRYALRPEFLTEFHQQTDKWGNERKMFAPGTQ